MIKAMRFQTKLTLVYLALFLVVQGVIVLSIYSSVTRNVGDQIKDQLAASARVIDQIIDSRVDVFGSRAQDLSKDFGFRQAVATQDEATIESALANLVVRSQADMAFVIDLDDQLVASTGGVASEGYVAILSEELKDAAVSGGYAARFVVLDDAVFEMVITPVVAPVTVGWIGLGVELDRETALEFKELSPVNLEIAFLYTDANDGKLMLAAATASEASLSEFIYAREIDENELEYQSVFAGQDYMFRKLSLDNEFSQGNHIEALLYYSVDVGLAPFQSLVVTLISILAVGMALLVLGSLVVSRGVTRPLRVLANAAVSISEGNYKEVLSPSKDEEFARLTGSFNQMVSRIREREKRIRYQACHDIESGLPNRNWFEEKVTPHMKAGKQFSIAIIELQGLLNMRTTLTHEHINELVISVAKRLGSVNVEYLSRLSTETLVFAQFDEEEDEICASMIINGFIDPFDVGEIVVDVRALMGLTKFPTNGNDLTTLLRQANAALDASRTSEKGYAWYDQERDNSKQDRLSMMSDLRDGLKNGEVKFAYQPKLDLASGKINSVEALVRWISPARGFVAPDDFIPLAENTGDVRHLTEWGLKEAIKQIADWRRRGIDLAIAVNLSTSDLMNANLPSSILTLLTEHSVPAAYLKLEVTESAVMHDMSRALDVLNMLNAMGVILSIDDYGTGYSSLSYIKKLPVREIKIDKSFVLGLAEDDEDKILVRSTIELAHNLGLEVTAEGVEDEGSVELLREYGCDKLQGYHICRPVPKEELEAFLRESKYAKTMT